MRYCNSSDFKWLTHIKNILNETGFSYLWTNQDSQSSEKLHFLIKNALLDQFKQSWSSDLQLSSKGRNYSLFKDNTDQEYYIRSIEKANANVLLKFRMSNTNFPVEVGRWRQSYSDLSNRKCTFGCSDVGDEYHYLLVCKHFTRKRKTLIPQYYFKHPSILKYKEIMTTHDMDILKNLCLYLKYVFKTFKSPIISRKL